MTITASRFLHLDRDAAAQVSFLLLAPVTAGAVACKGARGPPRDSPGRVGADDRRDDRRRDLRLRGDRRPPGPRPSPFLRLRSSPGAGGRRDPDLIATGFRSGDVLRWPSPHRPRLLAGGGPGRPSPAPLEGELEADVVVVGGGYTGLWTAWSRGEPGCVVVLSGCGDAARCGGRGGGFVNAMSFHLPSMTSASATRPLWLSVWRGVVGGVGPRGEEQGSARYRPDAPPGIGGPRTTEAGAGIAARTASTVSPTLASSSTPPRCGRCESPLFGPRPFCPTPPPSSRQPRALGWPRLAR